MNQQIIINADSYETRIAILEDGDLAELRVERAEQRRSVGDIYKGRVNAVLPGMQAAFVDLGLAKTAFLHASDLAEILASTRGSLRRRGCGGARRPPPPGRRPAHRGPPEEGPGGAGAGHQGADRHQGPPDHPAG